MPFLEGSELAVRHGARGPRSLRREHRRDRALPVHDGLDAAHRGPAETVVELPAGTLNHHWTKNLIASPDGSRLYVTVGSNSNVAENGIENEVHRAAILEIDPETGQMRVFAIRAAQPERACVAAARPASCGPSVNERDELGSDLVPDYLTSVRDGVFYGWPYSYFGQHVDDRVQPQRPDLVAKAVAPDYALGPHTALARARLLQGSERCRRTTRGGAFIGQHGSWNRKPLQRLQGDLRAVREGKPTGEAEDVLTGFVNSDGEAMGRPVGVAIDRSGALLVADDVGNAVWRVSGAGSERVTQR